MGTPSKQNSSPNDGRLVGPASRCLRHQGFPAGGGRAEAGGPARCASGGGAPPRRLSSSRPRPLGRSAPPTSAPHQAARPRPPGRLPGRPAARPRPLRPLGPAHLANLRWAPRPVGPPHLGPGPRAARPPFLPPGPPCPPVKASGLTRRWGNT